MPYLGIFDQKCLIWVFWAGIWKQYCHIWNRHPRICLIAKFREKSKILKFGTKNAWFGYFGDRILKSYCHIWNQHLRISVIANFCEETKIWGQKCLIWVFLTKNGLFWYFWALILKKLLSCLKSAPSNLWNCKNSRKNKKINLWQKMADLGILGIEF